MAKTKRTRSAAYPSLNLKEAIGNVGLIKKNLGSNSFTRESGAQALGHVGISGPSSAKIAALVHFGLLDRTESAYKMSKLTERILFPKSEEDKREAMSEAARAPKLYSKLINVYQGSELPAMLPNILVHDYSIDSSVSRKVAKDFVLSIEYAGLIKNGILIAVENIESSKEENGELETDDGALSSISTISKKENPLPGFYRVPLPSGIVILFPSLMSYRVGIGEFAAAIKLLDDTANNGEAIEKNSSEKREHIQEVEGK